jgi:hypothetical protein
VIHCLDEAVERHVEEVNQLSHRARLRYVEARQYGGTIDRSRRQRRESPDVEPEVAPTYLAGTEIRPLAEAPDTSLWVVGGYAGGGGLFRSPAADARRCACPLQPRRVLFAGRATTTGAVTQEVPMRTAPSIAPIVLAAVLAAASAVIAAEPSPSSVPAAAPSPAAALGIDLAAPVGTITWKRSTKGKGFAGDAHVADMVQLDGGTAFMCGYTFDQMAGTSAAMWSSKDGKKWNPVKWPASPGSQCFGLLAWQEGLLAVGGLDSGHLWRSANGKKWKDGTIEGSRTLNDIGRLGEQLAVIGDAAGATETMPTLWLSPDGSTWDAHPIAAAGSARHLAVGPDGALVVAGKLPGPEGGQPIVWRSNDGETWEEIALEGVGDGRWFIPTLRLTPAGYVLTLTFGAGGQSSSAWTSADGATWQQALAVTDGSLSAVASIGTDAMLIGPEGTWRSPDGVAWTMTEEDTFEPYDVLAGVISLADGRWLAGGDTFDAPQPGIATWIGTASP